MHSNRGGQYCAYRKLPQDPEVLRSPNCRGSCCDNAQAGGLGPRLKMEVLEVREQLVFANLADARANAADYFD